MGVKPPQDLPLKKGAKKEAEWPPSAPQDPPLKKGAKKEAEWPPSASADQTVQQPLPQLPKDWKLNPDFKWDEFNARDYRTYPDDAPPEDALTGGEKGLSVWPPEANFVYDPTGTVSDPGFDFEFEGETIFRASDSRGATRRRPDYDFSKLSKQETEDYQYARPYFDDLRKHNIYPPTPNEFKLTRRIHNWVKQYHDQRNLIFYHTKTPTNLDVFRVMVADAMTIGVEGAEGIVQGSVLPMLAEANNMIADTLDKSAKDIKWWRTSDSLVGGGWRLLFGDTKFEDMVPRLRELQVPERSMTRVNAFTKYISNLGTEGTLDEEFARAIKRRDEWDKWRVEYEREAGKQWTYYRGMARGTGHLVGFIAGGGVAAIGKIEKAVGNIGTKYLAAKTGRIARAAGLSTAEIAAITKQDVVLAGFQSMLQQMPKFKRTMLNIMQPLKMAGFGIYSGIATPGDAEDKMIAAGAASLITPFYIAAGRLADMGKTGLLKMNFNEIPARTLAGLVEGAGFAAYDWHTWWPMLKEFNKDKPDWNLLHTGFAQLLGTTVGMAGAKGVLPSMAHTLRQPNHQLGEVVRGLGLSYREQQLPMFDLSLAHWKSDPAGTGLLGGARFKYRQPGWGSFHLEATKIGYDFIPSKKLAQQLGIENKSYSGRAAEEMIDKVNVQSLVTDLTRRFADLKDTLSVDALGWEHVTDGHWFHPMHGTYAIFRGKTTHKGLEPNSKWKELDAAPKDMEMHHIKEGMELFGKVMTEWMTDHQQNSNRLSDGDYQVLVAATQLMMRHRHDDPVVKEFYDTIIGQRPGEVDPKNPDAPRMVPGEEAEPQLMHFLGQLRRPEERGAWIRGMGKSLAGHQDSFEALNRAMETVRRRGMALDEVDEEDKARMRNREVGREIMESLTPREQSLLNKLLGSNKDVTDLSGADWAFQLRVLQSDADLAAKKTAGVDTTELEALRTKVTELVKKRGSTKVSEPVMDEGKVGAELAKEPVLKAKDFKKSKGKSDRDKKLSTRLDEVKGDLDALEGVSGKTAEKDRKRLQALRSDLEREVGDVSTAKDIDPFLGMIDDVIHRERASKYWDEAVGGGRQARRAFHRELSNRITPTSTTKEIVDAFREARKVARERADLTWEDGTWVATVGDKTYGIVRDPVSKKWKTADTGEVLGSTRKEAVEALNELIVKKHTTDPKQVGDKVTEEWRALDEEIRVAREKLAEAEAAPTEKGGSRPTPLSKSEMKRVRMAYREAHEMREEVRILESRDALRILAEQRDPDRHPGDEGAAYKFAEEYVQGAGGRQGPFMRFFTKETESVEEQVGRDATGEWAGELELVWMKAKLRANALGRRFPDKDVQNDMIFALEETGNPRHDDGTIQDQYADVLKRLDKVPGARIAVDELRERFRMMWEQKVGTGQLSEEAYIEKYAPHIWDLTGEGARKNVASWTEQRLAMKDRFTKQRYIGSYAEGIRGLKDEAGQWIREPLIPKELQIKNIAEIYETQHGTIRAGRTLVRNMLNAEFKLDKIYHTDEIKSLRAMMTTDSKWADIARQTGDYEDFQGGAAFRYTHKGSEMIENYLIHKDLVKPFQKILYKPTEDNVIGFIRAVGGVQKSMELSLSAFHMVAVGFESAFMGGGSLNPLKNFLNGRKLMMEGSVAEDGVKHNLMIGVTSDIDHNKVFELLKTVEKASFKGVGGKQIGQILAKIKSTTDKALWDHVHTYAKLDAYNRISTQLMMRHPRRSTRRLKEQAAKFVNDAFGGRSWKTAWGMNEGFLRHLQLGMLSPDWTISNARVAARSAWGLLGEPMAAFGRGVKGVGYKLRGEEMPEHLKGEVATTAHYARAYAGRAMFMQLAVATTIQYAFVAALSDEDKAKWEKTHGPDTPEGKKALADAKAGGLLNPTWGWWNNTEGKKGNIFIGYDDETGQEMYIMMGKQVHEIGHWGGRPAQTAWSKASPMLRMLAAQGDIRQAGAGIIPGHSKEGIGFGQQMLERVKEIGTTFLPMWASGNSFYATLPKSKAKRPFYVQKDFEQSLLQGAEGILDNKLLARRIKESVYTNSLPHSRWVAAMSEVRGRYYTKIWDWLREAEDQDELKEMIKEVEAQIEERAKVVKTAKAAGQEHLLPKEKAHELVKAMRSLDRLGVDRKNFEQSLLGKYDKWQDKAKPFDKRTLIRFSRQLKVHKENTSGWGFLRLGKQILRIETQMKEAREGEVHKREAEREKMKK